MAFLYFCFKIDCINYSCIDKKNSQLERLCYVFSLDISGKVRIWDALGSEHILKYEYQVLGGAVKDIVWTEDSKRIVAGGEGKDK